MRLISSSIALSLLVASALPGGAQSLATNSPGGAPLSTRVVTYTIDTTLDMTKKSLDATEILTYRNLTGQPLNNFPFHLYLNAFRPESTFSTEAHDGGTRDNEVGDTYPARQLGSITIASLSVDGLGDLTQALHFAAPDDGNLNDHTVTVLTLPRPLGPGESITFHIRFHDQFPESIARNGYKRDFLMGGQWFPKVGVFWHGAWNCHQYHANSEFFADFGTFNVRLTLPRRFTVGASGVPTGEQANADGTRTLSFYGEDIHDFAFAASPHFYLTTGTFLSSLGPVQVRVLALTEHPEAGQRYLKILLGSMEQFDRRFGPYPYKILTLIDPEPGSAIGGMEYPTLVTGETGWFEPTHATELAAEHEFGHQYWYGMVATNEFEDAWLDEGINSYTEVKILGALLGRQTSVFDARWANASDASLQALEYISKPDYDPVTRFAWKFIDSASYGGVTYGKSSTLLATLEGLIGTDTMDEAMRTYFMRFRFTHPTTEDFLHTIEEVAVRRGRATGSAGAYVSDTLQQLNATGKAPGGVNLAVPALPGTIQTGSSLRPFFRQAVYGTEILDYAIDSVRSDPAEWWKPQAKGPTEYRDAVTIHRIGDFRMPMTVEVVFSDGSRLREQWNPAPGDNDRWHTWLYHRNVKVLSAELDPDHLLLLDRNRFNNSYTTKANPIPARKLGNLLSTSLQFASQLAGWLV